MILILDDTFLYRHKFNDVSYLDEERYKKVCFLLEKPTKKDFKILTSEKEKYKLLCFHRSLQLYNEKGEGFPSDTTKNFYNQFNQKIVFGRDITTNYNARTIDKNLFYNNLKIFLDYYIENGKIEIEILFYGEKFETIKRMTLADKIIDLILISENADGNNDLISLLNLFFQRNDSKKIINDWVAKRLTKKEIIDQINKYL